MRKQLSLTLFALYVLMQILGGVCDTWLAHLMFDVDILRTSTKIRTGWGQWTAEIVATFGPIGTILGTLRGNPNWVGPMVGVYISGAYGFTASTSFANPAVTLARSLSDPFSGIATVDVAPFIVAQVFGAALAFAIYLPLRKLDNPENDPFDAKLSNSQHSTSNAATKP